MLPASKAQTGVGSTEWIPCNLNLTPFNIGFGVVVSGTVNYTVEHTFDIPSGSPAVFPHPSVAAQTTNKDGNYAYPVRAIRLTVNSGTGTATLTAIQAGSR